MMKYAIAITLNLFWVLGAFGQDSYADIYSILEQRFEQNVHQARESLISPQRPTGYERFLLVFGLYHYNRDERIGRILVAVREQENLAKHYSDGKKADPVFEPAPANRAIVDTALTALKARLKLLCRNCQTSEDWKSYRRTVDAYFNVFNITDAHSGFSGLPFTKLMQQRFFDNNFQSQVVNFHARLMGQLDLITKHPGVALKKNIWQLALETTSGNEADAVELLGLLTSRDVLITRYMKYMRVANHQFTRAFVMVPVITRLLVELDRKARNDDRDFFSYDGKYTPRDDRFYYYWSAALAAKRLREAGYLPKFISSIALEFSRQYKIIRYYEERGFLNSKSWYDKFRESSIAAFFTTAKGVRTGLESVLELTEIPKSKVDAYVHALITNGSSDDQLKKDWVVSVLKNGLPEGRAAILFYDFASSKAGFSHLKFAVGTQLFEIHRFKGSQNTYLRERPILESLLDSKAGVLPSGILEFDFAPKILERTVSNLRELSSASMQYSFVNKLLNNEAFNCAGIIHEAMRLAGIPVGKIGKFIFLPNQIFKHIANSLMNSRLIGKSGSMIESLVVPNIDQSSFKRSKQKPNSDFGDLVGREWLRSEQALSASTPKLSNWRNVIGFVFPSFSANGNLHQEYTPQSAQTLKLKTFLIPYDKVREVFSIDSGFDLLKSHVFVEIQDVKYVRFFIHPNEEKHFESLEKIGISDPIDWIATPSSSARSLFVQDSNKKWPPFAVKTSLSVKMGGASRLIDAEKSVRAVEISALMAEIHRKSEGKLPHSNKRWDYMAEPISVMPSQDLGGFIVRSLPEHSADRIFLPVFALIAKRDGNETWINELYRYSGHKSKIDFVTQEIISPLVELHNLLSLKNGLTTELHQQNTLIEIDPISKRIIGIVLRDMDSHWIDYSLRTNRLKKFSQFNGDFKAAAYAFRYGPAQDNQFKSFSEILRTRSFEWIFKYFLSSSELRDALIFGDHLYLRQFNELFPDVAVRQISEMESAWKLLHRNVTSPNEAKVYAEIDKANEQVRKILILEVVRYIQKKMTKSKLRVSPPVLMCHDLFI